MEIFGYRFSEKPDYDKLRAMLGELREGEKTIVAKTICLKAEIYKKSPNNHQFEVAEENAVIYKTIYNNKLS